VVASALSATGLAVAAKSHLDKKGKERSADEGVEQMKGVIDVIDSYSEQSEQWESLNRALEGKFSHIEQEAKAMRKTRRGNLWKALGFGAGVTGGMFIAGRLAAEPINNAFEHYFGALAPDVSEGSEPPVESMNPEVPSSGSEVSGIPDVETLAEPQLEIEKPDLSTEPEQQPEPQAEPLPETPASYMEDFFGSDLNGHLVQENENIWKILEGHSETFLSSAEGITDKQKELFIDSLKDKVVAMSPDKLMAAGIFSGDANDIFYNDYAPKKSDVIDFSKLYTSEDMEKALKAAGLDAGDQQSVISEQVDSESGDQTSNANSQQTTDSNQSPSAETSDGQNAETSNQQEGENEEQRVESEEPKTLSTESSLEPDLPPVVEEGIEKAKEMWGLEEVKVNPLVREFIVDGRVDTDQYEEFVERLPDGHKAAFNEILNQFMEPALNVPEFYVTFVEKQLNFFESISPSVKEQVEEIIYTYNIVESDEASIKRVFTQLYMLELVYRK
jgi:hypothetical protein